MEVKEEVQHKSSIDLLKEDISSIMRYILPKELKERSNVRIISVGCGWSPEATVLTELLGAQIFLGVDNDYTSLIGARASNLQIESENFVLADAKDPKTFGTALWDLIILRNPQVGGSTFKTGYYFEEKIDPEWEKILQNCVDYLADNGFIYLGSATKEELDKSVIFLQERGLELVVPKKSLIKLDLKSNFPNLENYAAVFKKPSLPNQK